MGVKVGASVVRPSISGDNDPVAVGVYVGVIVVVDGACNPVG
jgi:hypothetical protein